MSFYDEIKYKADNYDEIVKDENNKILEQRAELLINGIKKFCNQNTNLRLLKGYVHFDNDYMFELYIADKLPTCNLKEMNLPTKKMSKHVVGSRITKDRIYPRNYVYCFYDENEANIFISLVTNKVKGLGFKDYNVKVVKKENALLVITEKKGFWADGSIKYEIEKDGYVYLIYVEIHW